MLSRVAGPIFVNPSLGPCQQRQVSLDDDAVQSMVDKIQEALKQLREGSHRSLSIKFHIAVDHSVSGMVESFDRFV